MPAEKLPYYSIDGRTLSINLPAHHLRLDPLKCDAIDWPPQGATIWPELLVVAPDDVFLVYARAPQGCALDDHGGACYRVHKSLGESLLARHGIVRNTPEAPPAQTAHQPSKEEQPVDAPSPPEGESEFSEPGPKQNRKRRGKRDPEEWEYEAYDSWNKAPWSQTEIAERLANKYYKPITQSQVSRAITRVAEHKGEPRPGRTSNGKRPKTHTMDTQKAQHVIPDGSSTRERTTPIPSTAWKPRQASPEGCTTHDQAPLRKRFSKDQTA